jgi:hypothetical protein
MPIIANPNKTEVTVDHGRACNEVCPTSPCSEHPQGHNKVANLERQSGQHFQPTSQPVSSAIGIAAQLNAGERDISSATTADTPKMEPYREVNAACEDHERHPHCQHNIDRSLVGKADPIVRSEKAWCSKRYH